MKPITSLDPGTQPQVTRHIELTDFAHLIQQCLEKPEDLLTTIDGESMAQALKRQLTPDDREHNWISLSALGKCSRALAYRREKAKPNGRGIYWRSKATFINGDIIEYVLSALLVEALARVRKAGGSDWGLKHWESGDQLRVNLNVAKTDIPGYSDGVLKLYSFPDAASASRIDCKPHKNKAIWSVKSCSSFRFSSWEKAGGPKPTDSEWWQAQGEMAAHDIDHLYLIAFSKDSGQFMGWWIKREEATFRADLWVHIRHALRDASDAPRVLPHGQELGPKSDLSPKLKKPTKKHNKLPWQCCYCEYYRTCWGEDLVELVESGFKGASLNLYVKDELRKAHPKPCPCAGCVAEMEEKK